MKRLILLVALVMAMAVLAPAALADDEASEPDDSEIVEEKDPFEAQLWKAQMIANYFTGGDTDPVLLLRSGGESGHTMGWGVLYKVMLCTGGTGFATAEAADSDNSGNGWAIEQLCKDFSGDGDQPKNFGQAHKDSKDKPGKPDKDMPPRSNKGKDKHEG